MPAVIFVAAPEVISAAARVEIFVADLGELLAAVMAPQPGATPVSGLAAVPVVTAVTAVTAKAPPLLGGRIR